MRALFVSLLLPALGVMWGCADDPETKSPNGGASPGGSAGSSSAGSSSGGGVGGTAGATMGVEAVGAPCQADAECAAVMGRKGRCKTDWNNGYCTADCSEADGCGAGASCETFESEMLCAQACSGGAADCRNGYFCRDMRACIQAN